MEVACSSEVSVQPTRGHCVISQKEIIVNLYQLNRPPMTHYVWLITAEKDNTVVCRCRHEHLKKNNFGCQQIHWDIKASLLIIMVRTTYLSFLHAINKGWFSESLHTLILKQTITIFGLLDGRGAWDLRLLQQSWWSTSPGVTSVFQRRLLLPYSGPFQGTQFCDTV